jgi:hypothetical protein
MIITGKKQRDGLKPVETPPAVPLEKAEEKKEEADDMIVRMCLKRHLKHEEAGCGYFDKRGVQQTIVLKYGCFDIPKGPEQEEQVAFFKALGFEVFETIEEPAPVEQEAPKAPPGKYAVLIRLQHPDFTEDNAIDSTITVAGEMVKIERGIVETDNPAVVQELQANGYIVQNPHDLEKEQA